MDDNIYKEKYLKYKIKYNNLKKYENIGGVYKFNKWSNGEYYIICKFDKFIKIINKCKLLNGGNKFDEFNMDEIDMEMNDTTNDPFNRNLNNDTNDFMKFINNLNYCDNLNDLAINKSFINKFNITFDINDFDKEMNKDFYYLKMEFNNTTNYIIKNNSITKNNSILHKLSKMPEVCTINSIIPNFELPVKINFDLDQLATSMDNQLKKLTFVKDPNIDYSNEKELDLEISIVLHFLILNVYTNQEYGIKFRYVQNLINKLNNTFKNYIKSSLDENFDYKKNKSDYSKNKSDYSKKWIALRVGVKNGTSKINLVYTLNEYDIINSKFIEPMKETYGINEYEEYFLYDKQGWIYKFKQLQEYIEKYKKIPYYSGNSKNLREEKELYDWIVNQKVDYEFSDRIKDNIMKYENIRKIWKEKFLDKYNYK